MALRKVKTKATLESSREAALLAVEIYNKPRIGFRSEGYIALMIIAWTRLFHAHFNNTIGDKYYYKLKNGRFDIVDGEKKAWDISKCMKEYGELANTVRTNLEFCVKLRNRIEHRHVNERELDVFIFGECQSLLFNYENLMIELFGSEYSINESLVYSLQFSHIRTPKQTKANKSALSKDLSDIISYISKYRNELEESVYNSQEYSIKLLQIPKISNTNRADAAIEFVRLDELNEEDKKAYEQITVITKDKTIKVEGANVGRLKAGEVLDRVNVRFTGFKLTHNLHVVMYKIFSIRPPNGSEEPFETQTEFCLYDEPHGDYVYHESLVEFLIHFFQAGTLSPDWLRESLNNGVTLDINEYRN